MKDAPLTHGRQTHARVGRRAGFGRSAADPKASQPGLLLVVKEQAQRERRRLGE